MNENLKIFCIWYLTTVEFPNFRISTAGDDYDYVMLSSKSKMTKVLVEANKDEEFEVTKFDQGLKGGKRIVEELVLTMDELKEYVLKTL